MVATNRSARPGRRVSPNADRRDSSTPSNSITVLPNGSERSSIGFRPRASSVRQVAAEYQLNPITVSRAYQELADEAIVEKRRGLGMYVTEGASEKLLSSERERFLREEWPLVLERIQRLGLSLEKLMRGNGGTQ